MTDDQHGEGTPPGGSRWDPLPHGDYDDGATAFVHLPEGGMDALLDSLESPLAAPGHGYVPPQITVTPTISGTDPAATGNWAAPGAPVDGAQWQESGAPAENAATGDRFTYDPGATGQWNTGEVTPAPGSVPVQDVTGQWSIPVAGGELPEESGEFTRSSLTEQWGDTTPLDTLPGGAPAPWAAAESIGRPWGPGVPDGPQDGQQQGGAYGTAEEPQDAAVQPYGEPGAAAGSMQPQTDSVPPQAGSVPQQQAGERPPQPSPAPGTVSPSGPYGVPGGAPFEGVAGPQESAAAGFGGGSGRDASPVGPSGPVQGLPGAAAASSELPGTTNGPSGQSFSEVSGVAGHAAGQPVPEVSGATNGPPEQSFSEASGVAGHAAGQPMPEVSGAAGDAGASVSGAPGATNGPPGQSFSEASGVAGHAPGQPMPEVPGAAGDAGASVPGAPGPVGGPSGRPVHTDQAWSHGEPGAVGVPAPAGAARPAGASQPLPAEDHVPPPGDPGTEAADGASAALHEPGREHPHPDARDTAEPGSGTGETAGAPGDAARAPEAERAQGDAVPAENPDTSAEHGTSDAPDGAAEPAGAAPPHDDHPLASYMLSVNGTERPVTDAWIGESLLYVLRERLGLAGAKDGCSQGECGACNVQVDGRLVASCLVPAVTAAGSEVRTVEGLAKDGRPSDVQQALVRCGAVQCGFCVPGMAMTVHNLLEGNPRPSDLETRQALSGNLCRCSGYRGVLEAVKEVVAERGAHAEEPDPDGEDDAPRTPPQAAPGAGPAVFGGAGPHGQPHDPTHGQDGGQA